MKFAHNIQIRVFCREEENPEKVLEGLHKFVPFNFEEEKILLKKTNASGFKEKSIAIFEVVLEKEKHTAKFIQHLIASLSQEQKNYLERQITSRLDKELNFFLRIDKQILLDENRYFITDRGNCYHIRISVAAFPSKYEKAVEVVKRMLEI